MLPGSQMLLALIATRALVEASKLRRVILLPEHIHNLDFVADEQSNVYLAYRTLNGNLMFCRFNETSLISSQAISVNNAVFYTQRIFFNSLDQKLIVLLNVVGGAPLAQPVTLNLELDGAVKSIKPWLSENNAALVPMIKENNQYLGIHFSLTDGAVLRVDPQGNILWRSDTTERDSILVSATLYKIQNKVHTVFVRVDNSRIALMLDYETGILSNSSTSVASECGALYDIHSILSSSKALYIICTHKYESLYQVIRKENQFRQSTSFSGGLDRVVVGESGFAALVYLTSPSYCIMHYNNSLLLSFSYCGIYDNIYVAGMQLLGQSMHVVLNVMKETKWDNFTLNTGNFLLKFTIDNPSVREIASTTSQLTPTPTRRPVEKPLLTVSDNSLIIWACSVAIVIILIVIALFLIQSWKMKQLDKSDQESLGTATEISLASTWCNTQTPLSVPGYLQVQQSDFKIEKKLTQGGNGDIYIVRLLSDALRTRVGDGHQAVAKCAPVFRRSGRYLTQFHQEVALLHYLNSQSDKFAELIGYTDEKLTMVMKYYIFGSVKNLLTVHLAIWTKKCAIDLLRDIADGISTMHNLGFAHCDIKIDNILVEFNEKKGRYAALVTDLGISRVLTPTTMGIYAFRFKHTLGISVNYAAPEIILVFRLRQEDRRTIHDIMAGDVYAYGIVMSQFLNKSKVPWRK